MNDLRDKLLKLPKRDFHNHLHLGGSIARLKERLGKSDFEVPNYYDGLPGMIDFIKNKVNPYLNGRESVYFFMEMAIENAIADNVHCLEASIDIGLVSQFGNEIDSLIELVEKLKRNFSSRIVFKPDVGVNKDYPIKRAYSDALRCMESGIFNGLDIYGEEKNKDLAPFVELYGRARQLGLKTKVHIGEFSNHGTIDKAILLLQPDEIQHGIKAAGSDRTMQMIKDQNIRLNICPQSNISLGAVPDLQNHPIRILYDYGIDITINTDDYLLFGASITDQLLQLVDAGLFSPSEIEEIVTTV